MQGHKRPITELLCHFWMRGCLGDVAYSDTVKTSNVATFVAKFHCSNYEALSNYVGPRRW